MWFLAIWELTTQKYGANALGLQRVLGLRSYTTAWAWLHKLRRAMVRPGRDRLHGTIEVDESYVGGEETGVKGRQAIKKAIVAIAVELNDVGIARIRLRHVPDSTAKSLQSFVTDVVEHGSTVRTDGLPSYVGLDSLRFNHRVTVLSDSHDPAHIQMPSVHRIASLLKRWLLGTLQGAVSKEHLPYYLDEFTFRFKMGIPLTQVRNIDTVAPWKMQDRSLVSITRARSKKWTIGSRVRLAAVTTSGGCAGPTDSLVGVAGWSGSLG